jgi:hypothetical protein
MSRFSIVATIAEREWRRAGLFQPRGFVKKGIVALALLSLPALWPGGDPAKTPVVGKVPLELEEHFERREKASLRILPPGDLVFGPQGARADWRPRIVARRLPEPAREALDALKAVKKLRVESGGSLPGRGFLLLLLAISLLTGGLSNAIPLERAERTLEALLANAVRPLEVVLGKTLALASQSLAGVAVAAGVGLLAGELQGGPWISGLTTGILEAVAIGLWLVRKSRDPAEGATVPLRVLPLVALGAAWAALELRRYHPILAGAVPLGGPLLLAGGLLPAEAAWVALLRTPLLVMGLGWWTARSLRSDPPKESSDPLGRLAWMAGPAWWLGTEGGSLLAAGAELENPQQRGLWAGGLLLLALRSLFLAPARTVGIGHWDLQRLSGLGTAILAGGCWGSGPSGVDLAWDGTEGMAMRAFLAVVQGMAFFGAKRWENLAAGAVAWWLVGNPGESGFGSLILACLLAFAGNRAGPWAAALGLFLAWA